MIPALLLLWLFACVFATMLISRQHALPRVLGLGSIQDFDQAATAAIIEAGESDPYCEGPVLLRLGHLWRIRRNTWKFLRIASELNDSASNLTKENRQRVQDLYNGLQSVVCSLTYKLLLAVPEVIRGRFRGDTHYHYTREVAQSYAMAVEAVESMARIFGKPREAVLRKHLA
jgi:hypothetical protein